MSRALEDVWRAFTGELLHLLGPERYGDWARNARPVTLDDEAFVFHFENTYARDKIETLLRDAVTGAAQRATNRRVRVVFTVDRDSFATPFAAPLREAPRPRAPEGTFGSFVRGPGNRRAFEAARAFALGGPRAPRVLLLAAPSGLGKSHLLRAIHLELSRRPALGVLHFTGDQFRRHFTYAFHRGTTEAFLKKCRSAGALLFDDLHLLCGKEEAQAALADVLDALDGQGARVAVTSILHPRRLDGLSAPLRRRLRADLEVTLDRPDPATGLGVLRDCAPPGLPETVLACLAEHVRTSHKDQLQCLAQLLEAPAPTLPAARAIVSEFLNRWSEGLTYADIVRAAADSFGVSVSEIYSPDRSRPAADARHACFYLARKLLHQPFARIGDHFGGRDHATVLQACRKMEKGRGPVRDRVRRLERSLQEP
ncbi:MAG TPA: DnaA/Hda family protein [Planctomycetota bacterium]|nr:DnaA/Hda family protein [Planctomycetota bacterium]